MRRGEIYYADLDPSIGSEINKKRPVVIISNNSNNRVSSTLTVLPVTSNISKIYPFEVALPAEESGLPNDSKIQCQQIRTISRIRIKTAKIGAVTEKTLLKIETATKLHLDFT